MIIMSCYTRKLVLSLLKKELSLNEFSFINKYVYVGTGASSASVDLLPSPGVGAEWTHQLPTDDGRESDQIYEFDGATNAVVIPEATLPHNLTNTFTLAFWMKHEPSDLNATAPHRKEHILCNADDHKMNRHHYAVFVRNCRLILLLRREFYQERRTVYRPAEWRWKMSEVCDNQWHHYALNVNFPEQAVLFVDGQQFKVQSNNPEIIDDWPLHATRGVNTTLVVGACWQGKASHMSFHFRGYLAGLSVLRGQTEAPSVLACLHRCKEGLEVPADDMLEVGTELVTNADLTEASIQGSSKANVERLVSRMGYVNWREFPTPGRRAVRLLTSVTCNDGHNVRLPPAESYVMVLPPDVLTISINGTPNLAQEYEPFKQGLALFSSVSVMVNRQEDGGGSSSEQHKLDSCSVQVFPPLNPDHEYFRLPLHLLAHLGIMHRENKDGLLIYGSDSIHNYESVLREILYFNRKPAYYLNRAFKLVCSELNGRFTSNEYVQMLTVIHPRPQVSAGESPEPAAPEPVAHAQVHSQGVELGEPHLRQALDSALLDKALFKTSAGHAVTVIVVVCAGFLLFMMVLGVIRIRAAHRRTRTHDEPELAWDDSALTITVNPMEQLQQAQEASKKAAAEEEEESSDEGSSYHDESSEEEERGLTKERELEWDDSTLTF
ncbi:CLSTN2 [Cordylochernes scorpioides]|uniref:CLSTN2 n=1 Tax=Cordylochernes scorpioides TaxID=51811 RepID=A0ABY6KMJ2_9ARAC|nr:CLSTN2 [Cordylochernes scorpioides]